MRVKGGLGNQLFCYAAARRMALANNADLVIDDVTGFVRDREYRRQYMLDRFQIPCRKATPFERFEPFPVVRRRFGKMMSARQPFPRRTYLQQEGIDFDARVLDVKVARSVYLDGLWQSEGYFKDIEPIIRSDLRIRAPRDAMNEKMAERIHRSSSVALHVRWFSSPNAPSNYNVSAHYYQQAIARIEESVDTPHYFVFSDMPEAAVKLVPLPCGRFTLVSHNPGEADAHKDLWLMTLCKYFITANSTFSWWGAWLSESTNKIVITTALQVTGKAAWGFDGLIPPTWVQI